MSDTPRVDAIITGNSDVTNEEYEDLAYLARALDRENAAMREAIKEAAYHLRYVANEADAGWDARDEARQALAKLQPFLKP